MASSKHQLDDEERQTLLTRTALRLFEAAPAIFPDHMLMRELNKVRRELHEMRKERDSLLNQMMVRYWKDNSPVALCRAMKTCNDLLHHCRCFICSYTYPQHSVACRFWDRFVWYMVHCGITWVAVSCDVDDVQDIGMNTEAMIPGVPSTVALVPLSVYPVPPTFDRRTSCNGLIQISHIDTHLVFRRVGRVLGMFYGRKLWQETDPESPEIRKLNLLFARLRA